MIEPPCRAVGGEPSESSGPAAAHPGGEHVVITPQTAGSAGAAHPDSGSAGPPEES